MTMLEKCTLSYFIERDWYNPIRYMQEHFPWAAEEVQQLEVLVTTCSLLQPGTVTTTHIIYSSPSCFFLCVCTYLFLDFLHCYILLHSFSLLPQGLMILLQTLQ